MVLENESVLVHDLTEADISLMSEDAKHELTLRLEKKIRQREEGMTDEDSLAFEMAMQPTKTFFANWASELEQLHYLGKFDKPLSEISTYIRGRLGKTNLSFDKKQNLYNHLDRYLDSRYKRTDNPDEPNHQNGDKNTSEIPSTDFMRFSLLSLAVFHKRMEIIAETLYKHLANPLIHKDFHDVIEWKEIALFSSALAELVRIIPDMEKAENGIYAHLKNEKGILTQIEGELNIRESATIYQKAMMYLLAADHSFRKMAHKFGVSPRQNQRIRSRMEEWSEKDPQKIIQNVASSYQCLSCGFNPVTGRKYDDVKLINDESWIKIKYADKFFPIPEKYKAQKLSPIQIAQKIWEKKINLE